jgi:hypothetical protein
VVIRHVEVAHALVRVEEAAAELQVRVLAVDHQLELRVAEAERDAEVETEGATAGDVEVVTESGRVTVERSAPAIAAERSELEHVAVVTAVATIALAPPVAVALTFAVEVLRKRSRS